MSYEEVFEKAKAIFMAADISSIREHLAFQFNITGEGEGAFYAEVTDGVLTMEPFEYYDRDAIFICTADTLFKIAEGKLDAIVAFSLGKLKVEGSIEKALLLQQMV